MSSKPRLSEPVAIVGSACRFAGDASSPSQLWDLLRDPRDVRSEISDSRFSVKGFYHPNSAHHGHSNVKHSYLLNEDPSAFDAEFFGINPIETRAMDPQQRILLETVYEAVESGGMPMENLRGSDTAVYAGVMCGDYEAMLLRDLDAVPTYFAVGTSRAVLSNRISYFFDWHGASVTMDTACSSSLVAVHMAIQALRAGDSRMAVACGSNVILGPEMYIIESKVKMLSPDGLGRMWDKDANGYARGDGVAAIVLKTLGSALADGDHIECIIRETGLNQDGTTTGLTMPSAVSQEALIRSTYAKAGLDLTVPADRPQFFEAHGTGTPAGDPIEAEAISKAFFGDSHTNSEPLSVGSIKTVLGHTEGTAGVAAILKAALAIQNSCIPPNLLFDNLSPSVAPFYDHLQILTSARRWPTVPDIHPRRASVNSFGFGGTNAHAILESYDSPVKSQASDLNIPFTPFVFSAASEDSLRANLSAYMMYLEAHPSTSLAGLAYTLRERRTTFTYRVTYSAATLEELKSKISASLEDEGRDLGARRFVKSGASSKILGVFTGQGAQYARMGAAIISKSPLAQKIVARLESDLAQLPEEDRPAWSLQREILADTSSSRLNEAAISQPLCTAIQVMLVDLLHSANIQFEAVVGHSSGEIAAAYAAGYLTARDAICIAYYRGLHCKHAISPNGPVKGAMLAAGTSMEDAMELCEDEGLIGRVNVAASNSSSSVTISGDEDAIEELEVVFADEKKFYRRLRVDQAYHSRHMHPCYDPYVTSLRTARIKAQSPSSSHCTWFSSVYDGKPMVLSSELNDVYWAENMTKPVLFSQALTSAVSSAATFDAAVEVGPHPALKGPATQTIQEVLNKAVPYQGTFARGTDARGAFSASLGFLWSQLDKQSVSLGSCELSMSGQTNPFNVIKGLPSYCWTHETKFWHESRRSRHMRLRQKPFHPLLGDASPDSGPHVLRWKNVLKPSEIPWVEGHQVQNQIVFPAAGYVATALEAAQSLAEGRSIRVMELSNFHIHQAVMFEGNDASIETLTELSQISKPRADTIVAKFSYSAALGADTTDLALAADGEVKVCFGDISTDLLPQRQPTPPHLISVDPDRLYNFMESLEYNFTGPFRSLVQLTRKLGQAACVAQKASTSDADSLLVHPVDLDAGFQSVMLAYSYPGDDQLRNLHLPTSIGKVRVNPILLATRDDHEDTMTVDSTCNREDRATPGSGFSGSVSIYSNRCSNAAIQVDQVKFKPVGTAASSDRNVFYKIEHVLSNPDGVAAAESIPIAQTDTDLLWVLCRIATFYMRQFDREVPGDSSARSESPLCHYLAYARHMTDLFERGQHRYAKREWANDTIQDVLDDVNSKSFAKNSDVRMMFLVGKTMPRVFKGETNMLEHFRESGLLDEYYAHGFGTLQSSTWLGNAVKQISDCHPHLKIMEIGAGTGGATKSVLRSIGQSFDNYTFTDVSSSFFENAAEALAQWRDRITFKVCDAEKDPAQQGFLAGTYDVVIAYMVIHATARIDETMRNLRTLLKPGGYLLVGEQSSEGASEAGAGFIFGPLPGWWRGVEEGRTLSPLLSVSQWDETLKRTGFSGIDSVTPPKFLNTFGVALFVSQAVDARIELARDPLAFSTDIKFEKLVLVGGQTLPIYHLAQELESILRPFATQICSYQTFEDVDDNVIDAGATIISLADLDEPVFRNITEERWYAFKKLFQGDKTVLWITSRDSESEGYANMTHGFGRSARHEEESLRLQYLDIPDPGKVNARPIAETLIRFATKQLSNDDILYTVEPELALDAQGRQLVPRINPVSSANDRMNCLSRPITHHVDTSRSVVELQQDTTICNFRELSRYEVPDKTIGATTIELRVTHTLLSAIKTSIGYSFLVLGLDPNGARYLALVPSLVSVLQVPEESAVLCNFANLSDEVVLTHVAAQLVAAAIIDHLYTGQKLVSHNASDAVAQAISMQASEKGVRAIFTTEHAGATSIPDSCMLLPSYASRSDLRQIIPDDVACFVGFSYEDSESERTIQSILPSYCRKENTQSIFSPRGVETSPSSSAILKHTLVNVIKHARNMSSENAQTEVSLEELVESQRPNNPLTCVRWATAPSLPVRVARLDIKPLFKSDKTYWLCGLSGALGISLCDWMIERGVKYLVLTSRNPKIDPQWLEDHRRNGVTVKTISCDVTNEKALREVHQIIVKTLPSIIGVLNGAMVLRDVSIANMEYEHVLDVIRPKVLGSIHLDRIFYDVNLDFFVLLSSINCVIGNVGQANYAAANMGMCGVAINRRKRGLNSNVVNVGAIIGVGYITQSDRQLDVTVAKTAMMHLSEEDFHQIFAESMEAGYVDSPVGAELSTGILHVSPDAAYIPQWYTDPKFSRFVVHKAANTEDKKEQTGASVKERLHSCRSEQEVSQVIKQAFGAQLRRILQVSTVDEDLMSMRSLDLGLDSLISVDIRSWFLKSFQVNIPVLKIMANDAQMGNMVDFAVESIPAELIPQLGGDVNVAGGAESHNATTPAGDSSTSGRDSAMATPGTAESETSVSDSASGDGIDWEAETRPSEGIAKLEGAKAPNPEPSVVLLTGCSGLLGHHLLNTLAAQQAIRKVICIAVRRLSERLASKQLPPADGRIVYYEGDLSLPRFGLTEGEQTVIFKEVDAVVHNGSDTSHLKYYSALRETNVGSTRQLIQLCLQRMIPLHYVSSAGVALFAGKDAFPEIPATLTDAKPPADGAHGYMCGKWVCESLLERVHLKYGLEVCFQRPSTIVREGEDATSERASFDWVNALIHYSHRIKAVPKVKHNKGSFDLVYVQTVCEDILRGLLRQQVGQEHNGIRYVNNVGDLVIPMDRMAEIGKQRAGKTSYEALPMQEWSRKAVDAGLHPAVAALIETFDEPGGAKYPRLLRGANA